MQKLEYILNQFHRTWNKKRENYCIERIYNKLDNTNLKIVTQQMFRRSNGRIALADLFFSQLKLSVEIDEEFHRNNKGKDEERTEDILDRMKQFETIVPFEPEELRIDAGANQTIESINNQIDIIVKKINNRIAKLPELNWDSVNRTTEEYIQQGCISAEENASFRTIWDVSKLFNKGYKEGCQRCWFDAVKGCKGITVWCPKVTVNADGYEIKNKYDNEISIDAALIFESAKENNDEFVSRYFSEPNSNEIRYVFPYYKTETGEYAYVFKGVYKLNLEKTKMHNKRVWEKFSDTLDLEKYH